MLPTPLLRRLEQQQGVVARRQVAEYLTLSQADDLLRGEAFERLESRCGPRRGTPAGIRQRAFAATLRAGPGATLTGPVVLGLLQIPGMGETELFEVLTPPERRISGVDFAHRRDPDPSRVVIRYGDVRVAEPVDALIDAAAHVDVLGPRAVRVAWDHLRWQLGVRQHRLRQRLTALRGHAPGAAVLQGVLDSAGGVELESEGERRLAPVLQCFDPPFEPQVWVTPGRRVDFFCQRVRYGFEYLGRVDHDTVAGRIADDARDRELRREGIRLGYVTAADLREPEALLATLAGTLTVRAHELGVAPPVAVRAPTGIPTPSAVSE